MRRFAVAWTQIAKQLLLQRPWDFENHGSPKGPRKAIVQIENGFFFMILAAMASHGGGSVLHVKVLEAWIGGELDPFGVDINAASARVRSLTRKRVTKEIQRKVDDFVFFDLFRLGGDQYILTQQGSQIFEGLGGK